MPLIQSLAGAHFPKAHVRRYIHRTESGGASATATGTGNNEYPASALVGTQSDFDYDAIAELIFDNETAFQTFFGLVSQPDAAGKLAKDEEIFVDRSKMKAVVLGDCNTTNGPAPSA